MDLEFLRAVFGWCFAINVGLLVVWFLFFWLAHDLMFRYHSKLFKVSAEVFDAINYAGLAILKIGIITLNLAPYLALHFAS